jgi:hypothetical protein
MDSSNPVSRRKFLEVGAATGALAGTAFRQQRQDIEKAEQDKSSSNPIGPDNADLHAQNIDSVTPPPSGHANVKPFKYSIHAFPQAHTGRRLGPASHG